LLGLKNGEIDEIIDQVETEIKQVMLDWGVK